MKLNENGDFCLLYVEPKDEKQTLFETIGMQRKPVVLLLPLERGQARSRLFQRPEDFSDLKHLKRQTDVSITFVTAGSDRLAQLATRYGFAAYTTIDAFAEALSHGRRGVREEDELLVTPSPGRQVRTGPLVPSATQLAAIQHALPASAQIAAVQHASPDDMVEAYGLLPESGPLPTSHARAASLNVPTAPLSAPTDLAFWPSDEASAVPLSGRATPLPLNKGNGSGSHLPAQKVPEAPFFQENPGRPLPRQSEIPPRRSALLPNEHYTRHPGWELEEQVFASGSQALPAHRDMPAAVKPPQRTPAPPSRVPSSRAVSDFPTQPGGTSGSRSAPRLPVQSSPSQTTARATARSAPDQPRLQLPPPAESTPRPRRGLSPVLLLLSLLILVGAGLGSFVVITRAMPTVPAVAQPVGTVSFISSEQVNGNTSQGIDDEIQINLHSLGNPASGMSYYAWLLGDKSQSESESVALGKLTVVSGSANLLYRGDAQHTNLLQIASRFLVTEENSNVTPLLPSPDTTTWRYYGAIPAMPDPNDVHHFAFLNHLRHLLADEPVLDEMELPGGLNTWFTLNTQALVQWTSNARDQWQNNSFTAVRNEAIRVLSYLDGMSFLVQDLPPASLNAKPTLDTRLASLGLLNLRGAGQNPPSYLDQLAYHLNGLINAPGSPTSIRRLAISIQPVMGYVNTWLQNLRNDDKQLLALSDAQLSQQTTFSLLDDMVFQANNVYTGNTDSATGQFRPGVTWIHQQLQAMAKISIGTYSAENSVSELGQSSSHTSSIFRQPGLADEKRLQGDLL